VLYKLTLALYVNIQKRLTVCQNLWQLGNHRLSQVVQWVHLHPRAEKEIFRHNLQGKFVIALQHTKCTPRWSKSQFLEHFLVVGEISRFI